MAPVTTGIKFHKLLHWAGYIRLYGRSGNWNTAVFETAHKQLKRWKHRLSYRKGSSAGTKMMRQMAVRNGHIDAHTSAHGQVSRSKGLGPGGFRGRLSLAHSRDLNDAQVQALHELERRRDFIDLAVEELYDDYMQILPPHCEDIAMLSSVLNTITTCLDCADSQLGTQEDQTDYHMCFFRPESHNVIQFWRKTFCKRSGVYVSLDRDIRYVMLGPDGDYTEHIGRTRWVMSLPNGCQFVVVQRMIVTPPIDGAEILSRLQACIGPGHRKDPIKRHCATLRLRPRDQVASYHILRLTDLEDSDEIEDLVILQPDFSESTQHVDGAEYESYFRLDYIIQ